MPRILPVVLVLLVTVAALPGRADEEPAWRELVTEGGLDGWRFVFRKEGVDPAETFRVEDGVVRCTGKPYGYMSTEDSFADFTLSFDWRYVRPEGLEKDEDFRGNSGYLLFIQEDEVWPRSIEVQGMNRDVAGIIPIKTNAVYETDAESRVRARKPVGEWNHLEIVVRDGKITASLNGTLVSTVTEYEPRTGRIGFQSEGAEIHWKNIRIRTED